MRKTRKGIFETNSSSTHSLTINPNKNVSKYPIPNKLEVCRLEDTVHYFCYDTTEEKFTILIILAEGLNRTDEVFKALFKIGIQQLILEKADWVSDNIDIRYGISKYIPEIDTYKYEEIYNKIMESTETLMSWLFDPESEISGYDNNDY